MCYNVAYIEKKAAKLAERFAQASEKGKLKIQIPETLPLFYFASGFDHPQLPVIDDSKISMKRWGLIPRWIKDAESANKIENKTLNAAAETIFKKPSYRQTIQNGRGILPVNGFYEWQSINGKKQPWFIRLKNEEITGLACLFDSWVNTETGEIIESFAIVTTQANSLMEKIHNTKKRMPFILTRENEHPWLNEKEDSKHLKEIIQPCDSKILEAYTVGVGINKVNGNRNIPESMKPAKPIETSFQTSLF